MLGGHWKWGGLAAWWVILGHYISYKHLHWSYRGSVVMKERRWRSALGKQARGMDCGRPGIRGAIVQKARPSLRHVTYDGMTTFFRGVVSRPRSGGRGVPESRREAKRWVRPKRGCGGGMERGRGLGSTRSSVPIEGTSSGTGPLLIPQASTYAYVKVSRSDLKRYVH